MYMYSKIRVRMVHDQVVDGAVYIPRGIRSMWDKPNSAVTSVPSPIWEWMEKLPRRFRQPFKKGTPSPTFRVCGWCKGVCYMGKLFFAHAAAIIPDLYGQTVGVCICCDVYSHKRGACPCGIFCYIQYI